jgi:hypothetical protein
VSSAPQYLGEGLSVSTYAGPRRDDGGQRLRFQITNHTQNGDYLTFSYEQMCALRRWFADQPVPLEQLPE